VTGVTPDPVLIPVGARVLCGGLINDAWTPGPLMGTVISQPIDPGKLLYYKVRFDVNGYESWVPLDRVRVMTLVDEIGLLAEGA